MPQIKSTLVVEFLAELTAAGVEVREASIPAGELRASQLELHEDNVLALISKPEQLCAPLLVSVDGYVLDGHHRWEANRRLGASQKSSVIGMPVQEALAAMAAFSSRHPELCGAKA